MKELLSIVAIFSIFCSHAIDLEKLVGGGSVTTPQLHRSWVDEIWQDMGTDNPEINILFSLVKKKEFKKALFQSTVSIKGHTEEASATNKALFALLLAKNNMSTYAAYVIAAISDPNMIQPALVGALKKALGVEAMAWRHLRSSWTPEAEAVWGIDRATISKMFSGQLNSAQALVGVYGKVADRELKAQILTKLAVKYTQLKQYDKAAKVINAVLKKSSTPSRDLIQITAGRMLYERGFLEEAQHYYQQIPKNSDYWFVGQQEMAWANLRLGQTQDALALTQTLVYEKFSSLVDPESYFVRSVAQLKVCDYPGVFQTLVDFKKKFKVQSREYLALQSNPNTKVVRKFLSRFTKNRLKAIDVGADAAKLPYDISKNFALYHHLQSIKMLRIEAKISKDLYYSSLNEGTSSVGFLAEYEYVNRDLQKKIANLNSRAFGVVSKLASESAAEVRRILKKMQLVETEMIQQVSMAEQVAKVKIEKVKVRKGTTGSKSRDTLSFPFNGEIWFDELANYKVNLSKGCHVAKR